MAMDMLANIFALLIPLGIMGVPLILCSFISMSIGFERLWFFTKTWRKRGLIYDELAKELAQYQQKPKMIRDEILTLSLTQLQNDYERGLYGLKIIGALSPLFGLLGTILGVIKAFQNIATHQGAVSPALIADGLWEAMLTTALGLAIALFALVMMYIFRALALSQLNRFSNLLNRLSLSFER